MALAGGIYTILTVKYLPSLDGVDFTSHYYIIRGQDNGNKSKKFSQLNLNVSFLLTIKYLLPNLKYYNAF